MAQGLRDFLKTRATAQEGGAAANTGAKELETLVARIADVVVEWTAGHFHFEGDLRSIPADLIGPFPTEYLLMETSVRNVDVDGMMRRLGGPESKVVAGAALQELTGMFGLQPTEMFVLSRAETPIEVNELLRQIGGERTATLKAMTRLNSIDLLQLVGEPSGEIHRGQDEGQVVRGMVERFNQRIGKRLDKEPLNLSADVHRSRLAQLLGQVGSMTHYELLDVGLMATPDEVHKAYEALARLVHPRHVEPLGLEGREDAVQLLFERATLAYLTLGDSERRANYNLQAGIDEEQRQSEDERNQEARGVARSYYERALEMTEREDYHPALDLVRQALRHEKKAEYFALIGRIESKNPNWREKAANAYREAIRLAPDEPSYKVELAKLMAETGDTGRAKVHLRSALQKDPSFGAAIDALEEIDSRALELARSRKGIFGRLKEKIRGS